MGLNKDKVTRDILRWRSYATACLNEQTKELDDELRLTVLSTVDETRLDAIATLKSERLIEDSIKEQVEIAKRRQAIVHRLGLLVGEQEVMGKSDLRWILRFGYLLFPETADAAFNERRDELLKRMDVASGHARMFASLENASITGLDNSSNLQDHFEE